MSRVVSAERVVDAPREAVFAYLADLEKHWQLADRFIEVVSLERPPGGGPAVGGVVRVRGPFGLGRSARTRVVDAEAPARLSGIAEVGRLTRARVTWTLRRSGMRTVVRLEASVERAGALDAMLLAAGGHAWLQRRFRVLIAALERSTALRAAPVTASAT